MWHLAHAAFHTGRIDMTPEHEALVGTALAAVAVKRFAFLTEIQEEAALAGALGKVWIETEPPPLAGDAGSHADVVHDAPNGGAPEPAQTVSEPPSPGAAARARLVGQSIDDVYPGLRAVDTD